MNSSYGFPFRTFLKGLAGLPVGGLMVAGMVAAMIAMVPYEKACPAGISWGPVCRIVLMSYCLVRTVARR